MKIGIKEMETSLRTPHFGSRKTPHIKIIDILDLGSYILLTTDDILEYKYRIYDIKNQCELYNSPGFSNIDIAICTILGLKYFGVKEALTNLISFTE